MKRLKLLGIALLVLWMAFTTYRLEGAIWLAEQICQAGNGDIISIIYSPFRFPERCPFRGSLFPKTPQP